jgi:transcription antitermination factor NusG
MKKQLAMISVVAVVALSLSACGTSTSSNKSNQNNKEMSDMNMNHSSSGEVSSDMKKAENPTFKVGDQVTIHSDHMEGMNGAKGTVVGAYSTTAYVVSYTPTNGGEKVTNHKWVIHEEIKDNNAEPYKQGDQVVLKADHMDGMNGAKASIDSAEQTTVYMVDYTPTNGGEVVKNHKWVTESEITK